MTDSLVKNGGLVSVALGACWLRSGTGSDEAQGDTEFAATSADAQKYQL